MKNKFKILYTFIGLTMLFTACTPSMNELGTLMDKSELKFSVTPDTKDPNMIVLKSLTPGVTPQWITPLGRSTRIQDTVKIAFPGTYKFVYGVESAGGLVQADTLTMNITTTNLSYVNDPLWTMICGGVGKEKTWILDINAAGVSKYFTSPKYFIGKDDTWESYILRAGGMQDVDIKAKLGIVDTWMWAPTWKDNTWIMPAADYGTMTFDLKNNAAHATINHLTISGLGTQNGTFLLDAAKHTLTLNNAVVIHNSGSEADAKGGWSNMKVLTLSEDYLQVNIPGAGSYNFISKDYADKWVPATVTNAEPVKTTFAQADLVGTWKYNTVSESWIGWEVQGSKKGGALTNNWPTREAMVTTLSGWGSTTAAATFAAADANLYIFNADGTCKLNGVNNTYTVSKGIITFGTALTGTEWNLVFINLTGKNVSVLNVTSMNSKPYTSSGIWLGQRNGTKEEDAAVQLVKQ